MSQIYWLMLRLVPNVTETRGRQRTRTRGARTRRAESNPLDIIYMRYEPCFAAQELDGSFDIISDNLSLMSIVCNNSLHVAMSVLTGYCWLKTKPLTTRAIYH